MHGTHKSNKTCFVVLPSASEKTSGAHRGPMFGHECNVFWPSEMIAGAAGLGSCENVLFITPLNNVVYVNLCIVSPYGHLWESVLLLAHMHVDRISMCGIHWCVQVTILSARAPQTRFLPLRETRRDTTCHIRHHTQVEYRKVLASRLWNGSFKFHNYVSQKCASVRAPGLNIRIKRDSDMSWAHACFHGHAHGNSIL